MLRWQTLNVTGVAAGENPALRWADRHRVGVPIPAECFKSNRTALRLAEFGLAQRRLRPRASATETVRRASVLVGLAVDVMAVETKEIVDVGVDRGEPRQAIHQSEPEH